MDGSGEPTLVAFDHHSTIVAVVDSVATRGGLGLVPGVKRQPLKGQIR